LNVLDGFEFGLAIRHATREVRHSRKKATAILCGKRVDHDPVLRSLTHGSISKEAYELPSVYRFNGAFERYGQIAGQSPACFRRNARTAADDVLEAKII